MKKNIFFRSDELISIYNLNHNLSFFKFELIIFAHLLLEPRLNKRLVPLGHFGTSGNGEKE